MTAILLMSGFAWAEEAQKPVSGTLDFADGLYSRKMYGSAASEYEKFIQSNPETTDAVEASVAYFRLADSYYFLKKYPEAIRYFEAFRSKFPQDSKSPAALFRIGTAQYYLENYPAAERDFLEVIKNEATPDLKSGSFFYLAKIYQSRGKLDKAVWRLEKLIQKYPDTEYAVYAELLAGDIYYFKKKYPEAKAFYQKALSGNGDYLAKSPMRFDINNTFAVLAYETKDPESALASLAKTLQDPQAPEAVKLKASTIQTYIRAEAFRENGRFEEALAGYEEVLKTKDTIYFKPSLYQAGFLSLKLKKNDQARQYLSAYIQAYPISSEAGRASLEKIQIDLDEEKFSDAVQGAAAFLEKYPQSAFRDVALYRQAMGLMGLKDFNAAAPVFEQLITEFKSSTLYPEALYGAAAGFDSVGQIEKAIGYYEPFTQTYPSHALYPDAILRLGFLYVQEKNYEKAARLYEDILLNKPNITVESDTAFWVIRYNLDHSRYEPMKAILQTLPKRYPEETLMHETDFFIGESLMGLKNYTEAAKYYAKSVEDKADGKYAPHAFLGMGVIASLAGNLEEAEKCFVGALQSQNDVALALRARFEIANLKLKRGNLDEAAKAFMHVAILYDDEKYCAPALFKAGECFTKLGNDNDAKEAFKELTNRYPKSNWTHRAESFLKKFGAKHV